MWLFTVHGFFSVVAARDDGGPAKMMIRARYWGHLDNLRAAYPWLPESEATRQNDYPYRIILPLVQWEHLALALAVEAEGYTNFKNSAYNTNPQAAAYHRLLHDVWDRTVEFSRQVIGRYRHPYDPTPAARPKKKAAKRKKRR